jgi:REP element-mobilizing transposase RayT
MESDGRKHPIHLPAKDWFNTSTIIFLAVCTNAHKPILANDSGHQLLHEVWQAQPSWLVGRYRMLPDHIHLFCAPADMIPQPLTKWVNFWKSRAARKWRTVKRRPSGSGISGIRNCGEAKITRRNGSMCLKIQLGPALLNNLKIGHIKAK